jgi:TolA-binding protein
VTSASCPSEEELSRALTAGAEARVARHLEGCATCRSKQVAFRSAIERARGLPTSLPDRWRRDEVRASLLAAAAAEPLGSRGRAAWLTGFVAIAAAAVLVSGLERRRLAPDTAPRSHVVVRGGVGARYELTSPPPWETVRLWEGEIDLDVQPLGPRDRVRVQVGDGEVEVRGTRFQVTARADKLAAVEVAHGRVEVRPAGAAMAVLGAGQTWRAPEVVAPALAPPAVSAAGASPPQPGAPSARPRHAARAEGGVERALRPTRQEALYDDAWDALRARRFTAAATGFTRVLAEAPVGPFAAEAAFWRATALARGGASDKALGAYREFIGTYKTSPRRGEASAILGWLLVDAQRPEEATPLFGAALNDPHENVRASAREGLQAARRAAAVRR